jgi:hypothetical protein
MSEFEESDYMSDDFTEDDDVMSENFSPAPQAQVRGRQHQIAWGQMRTDC